MRLRLRANRPIDPVERLHDYARVQRRAGFLDDAALLADVTEIAAEDVDAEAAQRLAREAVAAAAAASEPAGRP